MIRTRERELATAARLTRFRGDMNDDDFGRLVKEVVRVLYKAVELPVGCGITPLLPLKFGIEMI